MVIRGGVRVTWLSGLERTRSSNCSLVRITFSMFLVTPIRVPLSGSLPPFSQVPPSDPNSSTVRNLVHHGGVDPLIPGSQCSTPRILRFEPHTPSSCTQSSRPHVHHEPQRGVLCGTLRGTVSWFHLTTPRSHFSPATVMWLLCGIHPMEPPEARTLNHLSIRGLVWMFKHRRRWFTPEDRCPVHPGSSSTRSDGISNRP